MICQIYDFKIKVTNLFVLCLIRTIIVKISIKMAKPDTHTPPPMIYIDIAGEMRRRYNIQQSVHWYNN